MWDVTEYEQYDCVCNSMTVIIEKRPVSQLIKKSLFKFRVLLELEGVLKSK